MLGGADGTLRREVKASPGMACPPSPPILGGAVGDVLAKVVRFAIGWDWRRSACRSERCFGGPGGERPGRRKQRPYTRIAGSDVCGAGRFGGRARLRRPREGGRRPRRRSLAPVAALPC